MEFTMEKKIEQILGKQIIKSTNTEIYIALLKLIKDLGGKRTAKKDGRKLYYFSAEFLIGKLLSNNLISLGVFDEVEKVLKDNFKSLAEIEELEAEPSLGNGGLGRLAACFLDSIANLNLNGDGVGLNYHLGLFKQKFEDNKQLELPNPWIEPNSILEPTDFSCEVEYKDFKLKAKMYDIEVYGSNTIANKLHLFDIETIDESIVENGISFDKTEIEKNLTLFLYPDDSDKNGELLRIYQQYFMVSCGARLILKEMEDKGQDLSDLSKHVVIQINDTHPSMIIPEMIRLMVEKGIKIEKAIEEISKTCAYTNHTILAEALEKWPMEFLEEVVPCLIPIIKHLNSLVNDKYGDENLSIIDNNKRVHMARMDMHFSFSVNGVAYLHTEILKSSALADFYKIYPEKFNNKTNGITFRRWLKHCNRELAVWLRSHFISSEPLIYSSEPELLENVKALAESEEAQNDMIYIKRLNKLALKDFLDVNYGIKVDENSIFDIQIKRLHEYKRQQMNFLYLAYKYLEIKKGNIPSTPITAIFGAKAAPAYTIAKDIIHAILCLQEIIAKDVEVARHLKVVMIENYNVTFAEKLIPAADISEQISLASKEASGTGNMKLMLNGAITLGTLDGANVEIAEKVGDENIYIFGKTSEEIIDLYDRNAYSAKQCYIESDRVRELVNFLIHPKMLEVGNLDMLMRLHSELLKKDWFMTLIDLDEYIDVKEQCFADYEDRAEWARKMLMNISGAGFFSSDRTIREYNEDIWKL